MAATRAVADAPRGMRSVGEADLRRAIVLADVPEPEWDAAIETPVRQATSSMHYWRQERVAAEADGAAFHLSAQDWANDLRPPERSPERSCDACSGTRCDVFERQPMACGMELLRHVA